MNRCVNERIVMSMCLQALLNDIDLMTSRVSKLAVMSECLQYSVLPDIGREQTDQLTDITSQLNAMRVVCIDRLKLTDPNYHPVCI